MAEPRTPPLTSVVVALRGKQGARVAALPHVVAAISDFLDYAHPKTWSLPRACEANLLSLLPQLAVRGISAGVDPYYWRFQCGQGLVSAVKHDSLEMVEWLHDYCPSVLPYTAMIEAAKTGNIRLLEWLTRRHEYAVWIPQMMDEAAAAGQLKMLQYLHRHPKTIWRSQDLISFAARGGHLECVKWLLENVVGAEFDLMEATQAAIRNGHPAITRFLLDHPQSRGANVSSTFCDLVENGELEMAQWLYSKLGGRIKFSGFYKPINAAARGGNLPAVKWLKELFPDVCTQQAMADAAFQGHLDIVQLLHNDRSEGCTTAVMDFAAGNGHLEVAKWLHENRSEGCTTDAMDIAARLGHLEVVKWLHENRNDGCTFKAMDNAAGNGHLDIVEWLHENRTEVCTTEAMDSAARGGHLEVVTWLHGNRTEGCTTWAMDGAAGEGHLDVVKWLHENRNERCTTDAMGDAASYGYFNVVLFLHANRSEGCAPSALRSGWQCLNHMEVVQWLHANYPDAVNLEMIVAGDRYMQGILEHSLGLIVVDRASFNVAGSLQLLPRHLRLRIPKSSDSDTKKNRISFSDSRVPSQTQSHLYLSPRWSKDLPMAASQPLPPLTSALVALCGKPGAQVAVISDFLDNGLLRFWSLPRACDANLLSLLPRLAARGISTGIDPYYWKYECGQGLISAVKRDNLAMGEWLHECCPSVLPYAAMTEAARTGNVRLLQWLTDRHEQVVWLPEVAKAAASTGRAEVLQYLHTHPKHKVYTSYLIFGSAVRGGHLETLKWLHDHFGHLLSQPIRAVDEAVRDGHTEVAKFVYGHHQLYGESLIIGLDCAARAGDLEMVQWLYSKIAPVRDMFYKPINAAAEGGHLHVVQWLHEHHPGRCTERAMTAAVQSGNFELVQWLHENRSDASGSILAMDYAASNGRLDIVEWMHEKRVVGCRVEAMDWAAATDHLDVVMWLHENRTEGWTTSAMDFAAAYGHLEVVKWLHANRSEGCTQRAMCSAAMNGHLDVVKWLHANRTEERTHKVMNGAAANGHLDIVEWLHGRGEGCTAEAMDDAAKNGHLNVVKWLHENRTEGCSTSAMDLAARWGHLDVVKWLHATRSEGCTANAMKWAAEHGQFEVLLYLHANRNEGCAPNAIADVSACIANMEIMQWLNNSYPGSVNIGVLRTRGSYVPAVLDHLFVVDGILRQP